MFDSNFLWEVIRTLLIFEMTVGELQATHTACAAWDVTMLIVQNTLINQNSSYTFREKKKVTDSGKKYFFKKIVYIWNLKTIF